MTAQETAVYWIEYVIRHKGAPQLHYPAADMNFLQNNSIDVIAILLAAVYIVIKIVAFIFKKLCCRGRKSAIKQKRN